MKKITQLANSKNSIIPVILFITILATFINQNVADEEVPAFFLKIAKNLPRLGRSEPHDDYYNKNSNVNDGEPWYKDANKIIEISKRKIGYSPESDTRAWQHFPLSIEGPPELWRTLAGYSSDPLYRVSDDFNNELWSRDKRTNIPQE